MRTTTSKRGRTACLGDLRRLKDDVLADDRGSALAVVLILVLVMTVLSGMLLMAFTLHARAARRDLSRTQAFYWAEAGVYRALWYLSGNGGRDWRWRPRNQDITIFDDSEAQLTVRSRGGYLEISSSARFRNQRKTIHVLVGQTMPEVFDQAIVVGGSSFPLVVTGDNRIVGDVTVGGGVKPGAIRGRRFTGTALVEGRVRRVDKPQMPHFDSRFFGETLRECGELLRTGRAEALNSDGGKTPPGRVLFWQGAMDLGTLPDSLRSVPLTIISTVGLDLKGSIKLAQRLTVVAAGPVTVSGSVLFENALLFSETGITIRDQVRGAIQGITTGDIEISDDAHLEYPSTLFTTGHILENEILGSIVLKDRAQVTGTLILDDTDLAADNNLRRRSSVVVGRSANVKGVIYSTNRTTIQGQVIGSVVADHFYLYVSPTTYINWLQDAHIDRTRLGAGFKLPLLFGRKPNLEIVTWTEP